MTIKKNIQALYDQIILQEKQIIELTHYLNVTYGHVHTNRLVINELNVKVTILGVMSLQEKMLMLFTNTWEFCP